MSTIFQKIPLSVQSSWTKMFLKYWLMSASLSYWELKNVLLMISMPVLSDYSTILTLKPNLSPDYQHTLESSTVINYSKILLLRIVFLALFHLVLTNLT